MLPQMWTLFCYSVLERLCYSGWNIGVPSVIAGEARACIWHVDAEPFLLGTVYVTSSNRLCWSSSNIFGSHGALSACLWLLRLSVLGQVLNKVDLLTSSQQADLKQHFLENSQAEEVFLASASGGGGVAAVREWAASKLPEGPSLYSKVHFGPLMQSCWVLRGSGQ